MRRLNCPYLIGVYLAVNAVPDAYLVVDGPECALRKADFIHGRHDWRSTLFDCEGRHRIAFTSIDPRNIAADNGFLITDTIDKMGRALKGGVLLVAPLPQGTLTGTQYDKIVRDRRVSLDGAVALMDLPGSLEGDWLDGYAAVLSRLARGIDLSGGKPAPEKVAVVGYLMDRNEDDHAANIREIRRMVGALSLDLVSVWLSNVPYASLADVKDAGTIVSLPYGREAARILAKRTKAKLVELDLPFGLEESRRWISALGEACGRGAPAREFVREELSAVVPKLEWVVPHVFLNRRVAYVGDPYLLPGFLSLAEELGFVPAACVVMARESHMRDIKEFSAPAGVVFEPTNAALSALLKDLKVDLLVANSFVADRLPVPLVELGFPSYFSHALYSRPFLGHQGCLCLVGRMADALEHRRLKTRA